MTSKLSEELRSRILSRIKEESSDTKLSKEFDVSRKTIWRLRKEQPPQEPAARLKEITPPPPPKETPVKVEIPPTPSVPQVPVVDHNAALPETRPVRRSRISDVIQKVDPVKVHLVTYFAVQLLRGEHVKDVLKIVLEEADKKGVLFRKIQILDITPLGVTPFVRFRSDVEDAHLVVQDLVDRAIVTQSHEGFQAYFPSGRSGKFPTSSMCLGPKMGYGQTYAGTRIKRWKKQFAA